MLVIIGVLVGCAVMAMAATLGCVLAMWREDVQSELEDDAVEEDSATLAE